MKQQQMLKRRPSAHQKQMRFFAVFFATLFLVVFALVFYFLAKWINGSHGIR